MPKSILYLFITGVGLLINQSATAKESAVQALIQHIINNQPISADLLVKATNEKEQPEKKIDAFLASLLKIPFQQRQYVFPAIFESPFIPKKVRTHPEVVIWKGAVPTNIAPQLSDFSKKYLYDLNPRLYILLSPDAYKIPDQENNLNNLKLSEKVKKLEPSEIGSFNGYKPIETYFKLPKAILKNPQKGELSSESIRQLANGFQTLNLFLTTRADAKQFQRSLSLLETFYSDPEQNRINPIQSLVDRIRLLKQGDELEALFAKSSWKNADEFAKTADTVAKAYRVHFLSLPMAFAFQKIKGKQEPMSYAERVLLTTALMHEALPADVRLTEKYLSDIYNTFSQAGYGSVLMPVSVDLESEMTYINQ